MINVVMIYYLTAHCLWKKQNFSEKKPTFKMKYRKSPLQIQKHYSIQRIIDPNIPTKLHSKNRIPDGRKAEFEAIITGEIVWPWSPEYDTARKDFNNVYPAEPILIVYVANYSDVRECLKLAHEADLWAIVRSGGHSLADYSIGNGIIIDMSRLTSIYVDRSAKTLFVESGVTFEKLFPVIEQYDLHIPGGGCPSVAVAGYMMGGGFGLTSRMYGMNCDNVIQVSVMLADGNIVTANASQNEDLFWAIRGGTGGNFGVLLNITYKLHDLGDIYGIKIKYPIVDYDNAALALETMQNNYLYPSQYPNLGIETVLCTDTDNIKKIMFCASWIGNENDFKAAIAPMMNIPGAQIGPIVTGKYSKVNATILDGTPDLPEGIKAYSRSAYIAKPLSKADWNSILQKYMTCPNQYTMVDMECYGGQINQVPVSDAAFIHRSVTMDFFCDAFFNEQTHDQKTNEEWLEEFFQFMSAFSNGHSYQNYPNRNQTDYKYAYWGDYYNILVLVKNKYDPNNFFHYQQSIGKTFENLGKRTHANNFVSKPIIYECI